MLSARWTKVLNDLLGNKTRTGLIVLSISVGLFAIGMIANARIILAQDLDMGYVAVNPSSGTIRTLEPFDEGFVQAVGRIEGVAEVEGRAHIGMRFQLLKQAPAAGKDEARWRDIQIFAVPDYEAMRVNRIRPVAGAWPPAPRELLLERSSLDLLGAQVGNQVVVETSDRKQRTMRVAGVAHDLVQMPSQFDGMPRGYVAFESLEWLGEPRALNELHLIASERADREQMLRVLNRVKERVEKSGYTIPLSTAAEPGDVPLEGILQAVLLLLGVLGFLSLFLSAFLIINTISALVTQQVRQIGIMKAIGAHSYQLVSMYLALALVIALPLGAVGSRALSQLMAGFFNFDLTHFYVAPQAIALQVGIGLLAPLLSALYPVLGVLRITPADAMRSYGVGGGQFGRSALDRLLSSQAGSAPARGRERQRAMPWTLSRPLRLSLRNTFRRKGRLALTLATLTLGGAMFIGVFSVRASLSRTLEQVSQAYQSDVWVVFNRSQRLERIEERAREVPGVADARGWLRMPVRRVRADGSESENLVLYAPPSESGLLRPAMLEGRWLRPGERGALVVSTGALNEEPGMHLGQEVILKVDGRKATFRVVGMALGLGLAPLVYADYTDIARLTHDVGRASSLMVVTTRHDPVFQAQVAAVLEAHFRQHGLRVNSIQLISEENAGTEAGFNMVIALALVMAFLLAAVGWLGLMGTLSINVLERTREIGVMRAIGATDRAVAGAFIAEGMAIGAISWLAGTLIALPLSGLLSYGVGMAILQAPLSYTFSAGGVALWLGLVLALSALASFLPARRAARLTVREVLAYE